MPVFDTLQFRHLLGAYTTGVTVITARGRDNELAGVTINSFTSVSLDPPLILFCLEKKARCFPVFKSASHFAVNMLSAGQEQISRAFTLPHHPGLSPRNFVPDVENCPILRGTLGWLLCRKTAVHPGGDHLIFVGEVLRLNQPRIKQKPLIYFRGQYRALTEDR
jgi:3-hydroxy-9,10-secoandrosta-1,3,5(10)-triene-9,17-dione monooxygenase reductase component